MPRLKTKPEDFVVEEQLLYPLSNEGPHLFLWIEKRGVTTDEIVQQLARVSGLAPEQVGFAGRKDRHAVTRQWISLPASAALEQQLSPRLEGGEILAIHRHRERLRRGQLLGNRFEIIVRELTPDQQAQGEDRLGNIRVSGFVNFFGHQRFGRDGRNVERGRALLQGRRFKGSRSLARLMLSALQSEIFDEVVKLRMERGLGLGLVPGDLAIDAVSGNLIAVTEANEGSLSYSPTGPLPGEKMRSPVGEPGAIEAEVLERMEIDQNSFERLPRSLRLYGSRRACRVTPTNLVSERQVESIWVSTELPAGSYVTVLLEQAFGPCEEGPPES